jgi:hypothetical protein
VVVKVVVVMVTVVMMVTVMMMVVVIVVIVVITILLIGFGIARVDAISCSSAQIAGMGDVRADEAGPIGIGAIIGAGKKGRPDGGAVPDSGAE